MIKKVIFLSCAAAALTFACPQTARAQMAGGSMGEDEKKDEPAPATPKADDGAKPDAGKTDPAKPDDKPAPTKTLVFDKIGADWKEAKHLGKNQRAHYRIGKGHDDSAEVIVQVGGPKADWDKQLAFRCALYQGTDGKKLDKSAAKCDAFDVGNLKVKTAEISGTFMGGGHPKKDANQDSADKPQGKAGMKTILAMIEGGPDGCYFASLHGPDKVVDGARDAFIAFIKSAHVGDAKPAADEKKDDKGSAPANPPAAPGAEKKED